MWSDRRVVQVASVTKRADEVLGTGTIVAPGRVLTARHVLYDGPRREPGLHVRRGAWRCKARLVWDGGERLDVVLLAFEGRPPDGVNDVNVLDPAAIPPNREWNAAGYPAVREDDATNEETRFIGQACGWSPEADKVRAEFISRDKPEAWYGLSGGAVRVDGKVVAVITEVPHDFEKTRLWATPVACFWSEAEFRRKLGAQGAPSARNARVAAVVARLEASLSADPDVAREVGEQLVNAGHPRAAASTLASTLVERLPASTVTEVLNKAHHAFIKKRRDPVRGEAVWRMLLQVLPVVADWGDLVERAAEEIASGRRAIELPLRSTTIAEIVIAGAERRDCRFGEHAIGGVPTGLALVHVPAAADLYVDPDGSRRAKLVAADLAAQMPRLVAKRLVKPLRVTTLTDRHDEVLGAVEGELASARKAPDDEQMQYYVVFFNEDLGECAADCDHVWALSVRDLGEKLPSLRLVRLSAGEDKYRELAATIRQFSRKP